ncbi:poly(A) polymerase [Microbacteriaceae bacterium MWH-Ta3]|nr:poly(A) polymerase [Microbacteriaceae bacterium MWH-Ta3]
MKSVADAVEYLTTRSTEEPLKSLSERFAAAGFELALVGGPVRDAFLGRAISDLDLTTNARPDDILAIVGPIAEATWDVGREFGTIAARIHGQPVEITTYRADLYDGKTRKPEVTFGDTIEGDLLRRDFTMNAMALTLPDLRLVDPSGGLTDLLEGVLRTPGPAVNSFADDPLRMMRAARFLSQLAVEPHTDVVEAMTADAATIENISAERVRDELVKLLATAHPEPGIRLLVDTGIADRVIPEIPALKLQVDEHAHHKDVYEHTITVVNQYIEIEQARHGASNPDIAGRLAALLHDCGKPATKRVEAGGAVSFYHHDVVGAKIAKKRLVALRFDNDTIDRVTHLIEHHLRFFGYSDSSWTDSAVRRYVRDAGEGLEQLHILTRADVTTRNRRKAEKLSAAYDDLERRIAEIREREELDSIRPDLNGEQIMAILEVGPGRIVGDAYRFLLELRLDEGPLDASEAERRLRDWAASRLS